LQYQRATSDGAGCTVPLLELFSAAHDTQSQHGTLAAPPPDAVRADLERLARLSKPQPGARALCAGPAAAAARADARTLPANVAVRPPPFF
jgi:hypothetical protein